ncbi:MULTISPECIES: hypothetical protein [Thiorhodovibrio]|uniref:hypothetical protein n=1 Tax=Thiorhodovibrio TaxID=61593 RepID=UPI0019133D6F|nr:MULTISPECIES: hypothetical protein [Thiorhodovibrio]MBK5970651.1 hypothetical protein [Thiorhodovibrio winogradskyi]WPL14195.1 hypothetical protein Thiosp_04028 [Thiorhodovibrio litoralis]
MTSESRNNPDEERLRDWHRAFGIALVDVFAGAPWRVELEQELALISQELDVAIIEEVEAAAPSRRKRPRLPDPLPDGLENLRAINLLSYKSRHEPLDAWSLDELISYFVLYRKVNLNAENARHPLAAFGLYSVATRYPEGLARDYDLQPTAWKGVYDLPWGAHRVRIIVLNRIEQHPRNAAWELFASERDRMRQGLEHYRAHHRGTPQRGHWELLERLYLLYRREAPTMAYTMEQFIRETHQMVIEDVIQQDPEAILKHFDPEQLLKGLDPEARLKGLDPEQRLKGLDPEDRLKGLDPKVIEAWLAKQRRDH